MTKRTRQTRKKRPTSKAPDFKPNYYRSKAQPSKPLSVWGKLLRGCLIIVLVAVVAAGLYLSRVESVRVEGVHGQTVQDDIKRQVAGNNKFLWQVYTSSSDQTVDYPDNVAGVELEADWRDRTITVLTHTHRPALIWETEGERYEIDERGYAASVIGSGSSGEDTDSLPLVRDDSNLPIETGEQVTPAEFVGFAASIADSNLPIEQLRVVDTTRELYADLDKGYFIRFDATRSADSQIDSARRTQELAERENDVIEQYIDVRLQYKTYYR